jgi:hypothetical protein
MIGLEQGELSELEQLRTLCESSRRELQGLREEHRALVDTIENLAHSFIGKLVPMCCRIFARSVPEPLLTLC